MIRPLVPADHDRWMQLWRGYQAFYEMTIVDDVSQVTWGRLLDPAEPMRGALAFAEGKAVGLVHWIKHRSSWTVGDYCYLQDLFVVPAARGRGTGRGLIDTVCQAARECGCSRVYWLTHKSNTEAMTLYDKVSTRTDFVQYRTLL